MKEIIIECAEMETMEKAFQILERSLEAPKGSITDLDSLYEFLTGVSKPVEITFEDMDLLEVYLGDDGDEIIETFAQAAAENDHIELV